MDNADLLERHIRMMLEAPLRKDREEAATQLEQALNSNTLAPEQEMSVIGAYLTRFHDPSEAIRLRVIEIVRTYFASLGCLDRALPRTIYEIHTILSCSPVTENEKSEVVRLALLKLLLRAIHTCNEDNPALVENLSLFFKEITDILKAQMKENAPDNRIMVNKCLFKLTKTYQRRSHLWDKDIVRDMTTALLENYAHIMYTVRMTTVDVLCSLHLSPASEDIVLCVSPYVSLLVTDSNFNVRRSVATMAATLLNEHIDRHVYLDFFCGILLSLALDRELHSEVFDLFVGCGEVYEQEHKDDLRLSKELNSPPIINNYNRFLERVAPQSYLLNVIRIVSGSETASIEGIESYGKVLRLSLGCRSLGERTTVKVIKAVLADITGSSDSYRAKACDMLAMLLLLNEHNNIRYSPIILEAILSLFVSDKVKGDVSEKLVRIVNLIFSFLLPREIVCFMLSFYRRSQLSTRQVGGLLTLIEMLADLRSSFLTANIRYLEPEHRLNPGYVLRLVNEIVLKDDILYSDDTYVHTCFKSCVYAIVRYIIVLGRGAGTEALAASLQEEGEGKDIASIPDLLAKLTICIVAAESKQMTDTALAAAFDMPYMYGRGSGGHNSKSRQQYRKTHAVIADTDLSKYESKTITELLQAIIGKDSDSKLIAAYFTGTFALINLDPSSHDLEKRMGFFMRMMLSFIAAGYQIPREVETVMRSLFIQLMRLTSKTDYSPSVRLAACRCIYLILSCLTRTFTMDNANMRYYFSRILQVATWQFGARTPECLEYLLRSLALLIGVLTTESYEMLCKAQKDIFGTIIGRIVSNLDGDTPGCRIAALDMLRGMYRYINYVRTLEILYQLVQRVNDCVSVISTDALYLCGEILSHNYERRRGEETGGAGGTECSTGNRLIITNKELLKLIVLHVDDSVTEISDACVTVLKQMRGICTELTCHNIKQIIEERMDRCNRRILYTELHALYVDAQCVAEKEEMLLTKEYEAEVERKETERKETENTISNLAASMSSAPAPDFPNAEGDAKN